MYYSAINWLNGNIVLGTEDLLGLACTLATVFSVLAAVLIMAAPKIVSYERQLRSLLDTEDKWRRRN